MQYSYFWPIMLNIMLMRQIAPHFVQVVAWLPHYKSFDEKCIEIFLALCLMLSVTYYAQNYAGIIDLQLGLPKALWANIWEYLT